MRMWKACFFTALVGTTSLAMAANPHDVPSCYEANKLTAVASKPEREVFILLDQTTPLDIALQKSVMDNASRLIQPGTAYSIATFSSFGQGRYLELLSSGALEVPLPEAARNSVGVKVLRNLDACLSSQQNFVRKAAATALQQAMAGISTEYAKSDVMASIKEMSARVKQSEAPSKILFLVSDMLENSGISSFYANRNVRLLNAGAEIQKTASAGMLAELAGARVFVLGAGLVQDANSKGSAKDSGVYRDPKTMTALKDFWAQYFQRSDAKLQEFGMPALLVPVQ